LLLLIASLACGQERLKKTYSGGYQVTGTSAKATVQLPSTATAVNVRLISANVTCPDGTCTITLIRNGTTATATAGTVVKSRTGEPAAQAGFYTASNSSGGTSLPVQPLPGTGILGFDLLSLDIVVLPGENFSVAVATGTSQQITVNCSWEEYNPSAANSPR